MAETSSKPGIAETLKKQRDNFFRRDGEKTTKVPAGPFIRRDTATPLTDAKKQNTKKPA